MWLVGQLDEQKGQCPQLSQVVYPVELLLPADRINLH